MNKNSECLLTMWIRIILFEWWLSESWNLFTYCNFEQNNRGWKCKITGGSNGVRSVGKKWNVNFKLRYFKTKMIKKSDSYFFLYIVLIQIYHQWKFFKLKKEKQSIHKNINTFLRHSLHLYVQTHEITYGT